MKLEIKIINVIRDVSVWLKKEEKRIGKEDEAHRSLLDI